VLVTLSLRFYFTMIAFTYFYFSASLMSVSFALTLPAKRATSVGFAADPSIDAAAIFDAAQASLTAGKDVLATFPATPDSGNNVKILGDWQDLDGVSAIHYIADMDVDCDGVDENCPNNPDGQSATSFGDLDASKVPFYVIPLKFHQDQADKIKANALGAIVCNGKMFYGIFGDEDADDPQVIGEASLLMAQTCFPDDGLDGGTGHSTLDVLYIIFGDQVPDGVGEETIDINALKTLGDQQAKKLAAALGV